MSIIDAFTGEARERERKLRLERLAESMSKVAAEFGLTNDELVDALKSAVERKRLRKTESDIDKAKAAGLTK